MKRRTRFATPLVIVAGCGQPVERPTAPSPRVALHDAAFVDDPEAHLASDAAVSDEWRPPDAPPFDPNDKRTWPVAMRCKDPSYKGSCNPPAPPPAPSVAEGNVISVRVVDGGLRFVVAVGSDAGVAEDWTGVLVTDGGAIPIACTIFRVSKASTACTVTATDAPTSAKVRFSRPRSQADPRR